MARKNKVQAPRPLILITNDAQCSLLPAGQTSDINPLNRIPVQNVLSSVDTKPADLPLAEMLRIMDVARTLRQEREIAQEQFNREEARQLLRQRLMASTEITGSQVTDAEIDAAIESYFNNLHTYHDPPWGVEVFLAHLYVRRVQVFVVLIVVAVLIAGLWLLTGGRS
jgi:hypothetical protein